MAPGALCNEFGSWWFSPRGLRDKGKQPVEANLVILVCASVSPENCH